MGRRGMLKPATGECLMNHGTLRRRIVELMCLVACAHAAWATDLPTLISSDTTMTYAASPYHMVGDTTIAEGTTVTMESGVVVTVDGDYELRVSGTLLVAGSDYYKVFFQPVDAQAIGVWRGIFFTDSGHGELQYAVVRGAKTNITVAGGFLKMEGCYVERAETDGMFVFGHAFVGIVRCNFRNNGRRGLYVESTEAEGNVWRTYFISNGEYPVYAKATSAEILKLGNRYHFNGINRIGVSCSALNDINDVDGWYGQGGLHYDLSAGAGSDELAISGILLIDAGVAIRGTDIDVTGRIDTNGSSAHPITIIPPGESPGIGDWQGITLRPGSTANFNGLIVRYAENGIIADGATLKLHDGWLLEQKYDGVRCMGNTALNMSQTVVQLNGRDGLRIEGWKSSSAGVRNCRFYSNGRYPVYCQAGAVRLLRANNIHYDNAQQVIGVACHKNPDIKSGVHEWVAQGVALDLRGDADSSALHLAAAATLNLGPGVKVVGGALNIDGELNTDGTAESPVCFDGPGASPQPGDWDWIRFNAGSRGTLKGANISNAIHGLDIASSDVRVEECDVRHSEYDGIRCTGNAAPVVYKTWTVQNGRYGVYIADNAEPNFGNVANAITSDDGLNHIHDNGSYEAYNSSPHDIYIQNNYWNTTDLDVVLANTWDGRDSPGCGMFLFGTLRTAGLSSVSERRRGSDACLVMSSASAQATPGGAVQLTYRVSADAHVQAVLTNIAGRPITELHQDAKSDALMTLWWNGRSLRGTRCPPGRYLCTIQACSDDGESSRVMVPVWK